MTTVWSQRCDRCGRAYESRQCKLVCTNCGARLDCSDLFIDWQQVQRTRRAIQARTQPADEAQGRPRDE
jgi:rRNA maturation endonuclease Nob1